MGSRDDLKNKFKNSYFVINKIYVFLAFVLVSITNATLGFYSFAISFFVYIFKLLTSQIPLHTDKDILRKTYVYKETESKDLKLDLYYPNPCMKKKTPLVYFCHGGGWISGFRNQPNNISWCKFLASKGFVVASIDYRYGYKNSMLDILSDYKDGLDFLRKRADSLFIDKDNIVLMGLSAGAHLSLLYSTFFTNTKDSQAMYGIKSVVAYYPPADLNDIFIDENKSLFARFAISKTLDGTPIEKENVYDFYSPIHYLSENMVPCFIAHGAKDKTVPYISSLKFCSRLKELKVPYVFFTHKTGDHSFDTKLKDHTTINIINRTYRFINQSFERS